MIESINKDIKIVIVTIFHMFKNLQDLFNILCGFLEDIRHSSLIYRDENYNIQDGKSTKFLICVSGKF